MADICKSIRIAKSCIDLKGPFVRAETAVWMYD